MKKIYLWQNERFPQFEWDTDVLLTPLGEVHTLQGQLLGRMAALGFEGLTAQVEALTNEILGSSQIMQRYLSHPDLLDSPPETVKEDID